MTAIALHRMDSSAPPDKKNGILPTFWDARDFTVPMCVSTAYLPINRCKSYRIPQFKAPLVVLVVKLVS